MINCYLHLVRPLFFLLEGEQAHSLGLAAASFCDNPLIGGALRCALVQSDPSLKTNLAGLGLDSPIGIAAGFDKEGRAIGFAQSIGASHIEVGTVTVKPQSGNQKPRVFRIPQDEAIVNRMGFPSSGVESVLPRLHQWISKKRSIKIGINIGKNKNTPISEAVTEYGQLSKKVAPFCDYICINVSSPNTPDLRTLQEPERLFELLMSCKESVGEKPLFVKLSPDIEREDLEPIVRVVSEVKIDAIVATNTTISRQECPGAMQYEGGLSGAPLFNRSLSFVDALYKELGRTIPIVGVGGIDSSEKAIKMFSAGASALQLYTALIFKGPAIISTINHGISSFLKERCLASISEIVGNGTGWAHNTKK